MNAALLVFVAVLPFASACGSHASEGATDNQLTCAKGTVVGRESPDTGRDGAETPEVAVNFALLSGERAESSSASTQDETVTVFARTKDGVTARFKTVNLGRGWYLISSVRCTD